MDRARCCFRFRLVDQSAHADLQWCAGGERRHSPLAEELPSLPVPADVLLVADGNTYLPAHSTVLKLCSQLLSSLLKDIKEGGPSDSRIVLRLPDTQPRQLLHLLKMLYTSTSQRDSMLAAMDMQDLRSLAEAASASQCYEIVHLVDVALVERRGSIDPYSAVQLFLWAHKLRLPSLFEFCGQYIRHHRDDAGVGTNKEAMALLQIWAEGSDHIHGRGMHWGGPWCTIKPFTDVFMAADLRVSL